MQIAAALLNKRWAHHRWVAVPFLLTPASLADQYGVGALLKIAPAFIIGEPRFRFC